MKETNIDCRKHRKSTHLASADLDARVLEGKSLIFTIKEVWYETGVDVSGKKVDAYFCSFTEGGLKSMVLNSVNRKQLSKFAKQKGFTGEQAYNIGNWHGLTIELYVDRNVKMAGEIVDGIRIKTVMPELVKLDDKPALEKLSKATNKEELAKIWSELTPAEKNIPTVLAKKDEMKGGFSNVG